MHKDLSDDCRKGMETFAKAQAEALFERGQSLALARETWINAFDRAAEELGA